MKQILVGITLSLFTFSLAAATPETRTLQLTDEMSQARLPVCLEVRVGDTKKTVEDRVLKHLMQGGACAAGIQEITNGPKALPDIITSEYLNQHFPDDKAIEMKVLVLYGALTALARSK